MSFARTEAQEKDSLSGQVTSESNASERLLTTLVEGTVRHMPQIDSVAYEEFRSRVNVLALQMPDHLPEADKMLTIRSILQEFEGFRLHADTLMRERLMGWRSLVGAMLHELFGHLGVDPRSSVAHELSGEIKNLNSVVEIESYAAWLHEFLHPGGTSPGAEQGSNFLGAADRTTANDNASGLRGGGAAIEHVKRLKESRARGFVIMFRLSFLDVISERFGMDAVEDCIMAVSAYLTQSLRSGDVVYHWSDSVLMGVLENRASPQIVTAELGRIVAQNREISINLNGRTVMFRIPIEFDVIPLERISKAEDLNLIPGNQAVNR